MRALVLLLAIAACQAPVSPTAPANAAHSTFRVDVTTEVDAERLGLGVLKGRSSGTAWVVFNEPDRSYLVTAGHVCEKALEPVPETLGGGFVFQTSSYVLHSQDDHEYPADVYVRSDEPDLCLLVTRSVVGPPMAISSSDAFYDEPVAYVGAPVGVYGSGRAPMFRGTYAGGDVVAVATAGGASGSAVFTAHGVIGVLVRVNRFLNSLTYIVPRSDLLAFLREHRLPV